MKFSTGVYPMKNSHICIMRLLIVITLLLPSMLYAQDGDSDSPSDIPDADEVTEFVEEMMGFYEGVRSVTSDEDRASLFSVSEDNAVTGVPFLDDFNPDVFFSLQSLPKGQNGGFTYLPGKWKGTVQSYCLDAGRAIPGTGDAYLTSPISGQNGGVVNSILKNSSNYPEIQQLTIQSLLYGIAEGLTIDEMRPEMQDAAYLLLTSEEIDHVNESIPGMIPGVPTEDPPLQAEEIEREYESMPDMSEFLETQSALRELITGGGSLEEIEALAMPDGENSDGARESYFPSERWSCRPDEGYFIRYFTRGDLAITVEVVIPNFFVTEYDDFGRITAINSCYGRCLEIEYDDTINPLNFGDADITGYAFKSIRFERRADYFSGPVLVDEWNDTGWTLSGYLPSEPISAEPGTGRFSDAEERLEWVFNHADEVDGLCRIPLGQPAVVEFGLLANAIQEAVGGDANDPVVEYCRESWMDALLWVMSWAESSSHTPEYRIAALPKHIEARKGDGDSSSGDFDPDNNPNDIETVPLVPDDEVTDDWGIDLSGEDDWGMDLSGEDLEGRIPDDWDEGEPWGLDLSGGAAAGDAGNQPLGITNDTVDTPEDHWDIDDIETVPLVPKDFVDFGKEFEDYLRENEIGDYWEGYKHGYFDGVAVTHGYDYEVFQYDLGDDYSWGYNSGMEASFNQFGGDNSP